MAFKVLFKKFRLGVNSSGFAAAFNQMITFSNLITVNPSNQTDTNEKCPRNSERRESLISYLWLFIKAAFFPIYRCTVSLRYCWPSQQQSWWADGEKYCQNNGLCPQQDTQLHRAMIVMQETSPWNLGTTISLEANHSLSAPREASNGGNDSTGMSGNNKIPHCEERTLALPTRMKLIVNMKTWYRKMAYEASSSESVLLPPNSFWM